MHKRAPRILRSLLPFTVLAALGACSGAPSPDETSSADENALSTSGSGLSATYYSDDTLTTAFTTRVDATLNFDWGLGAPVSGMSVDHFSARWTGQVDAPVSGSYVFTTTSDDGVRMWIDGALVIDDWTTHAAKDDSATVTFAAGSLHDVKIEYEEVGGRAKLALAWAHPGQTTQIVPASHLFPPATGIGVSGNRLTRNGQPWTPKGLSMIGALTKGSAVTAYQHWGTAELAAAASWGADALRFQVSQPSLDPQDAQYSAAYLTRVESMVSLAEAHGFALILSMQDQSLAGGNADPLPTASTVRAWQKLAPVFAADRNVIYELYNEPDNAADAAGWAAWKNGTATTVGHQHLVDVIRAAGAKNVLLADGARKAEILTGVPLLNDPLGRMGYASHPYYVDSINGHPTAWDDRFGNLSATVPVVVTEWNDTSTGTCEADAPTRAPQLVTYLGQHHIGIFGWAFDLPGTLVKDWSWTPTTLTGFTCGTTGGGVGALLKSTYSQ